MLEVFNTDEILLSCHQIDSHRGLGQRVRDYVVNEEPAINPEFCSVIRYYVQSIGLRELWLDFPLPSGAESFPIDARQGRVRLPSKIDGFIDAIIRLSG